MLGLPKLEGADWTKADTLGLMPSDELYKDWLDGFKHTLSRWQRLFLWFRWPFGKQRARSGSSNAPSTKTNLATGKARFRPLRDRVIIKRAAPEPKTALGIIVPDIAQSKSQHGQIVAAGPGGRDKRGRLVPNDLKAGDEVFFGEDAGLEVNLGGVTYLVMGESDVMGIVSTS